MSDNFTYSGFNRPLDSSELEALNATPLYIDNNSWAIAADIPIGKGHLIFGGINGRNNTLTDYMVRTSTNRVLDILGRDQPVKTPIPLGCIILTFIAIPMISYYYKYKRNN